MQHLITPGLVHVPDIPGSSNKCAGLQLNISPYRWQPLIHHIAAMIGRTQSNIGDI
jgi:hypothetical protein